MSTPSGTPPAPSCTLMVTFFSEDNYTGTSFSGCGKYQQCINASPSFNDQTSSVELGTAGNCTLYHDYNCQCSTYIVTSTTNLPPSFNQVLSKFLSYPPTPKACGCYFEPDAFIYRGIVSPAVELSLKALSGGVLVAADLGIETCEA